MRKYVLVIMFLAVALGASAKFRWGPTAGVNFSKYYWKQHLVGSDMLTGFQAGVRGELMIPGIGFGIDFGLLYANSGGRVHFGDQYIWSSDGIGTTDLRLSSIQIPLNLRFKYTRLNGIENYIAPFAFAGPQFNFNVAHSSCRAIDMAGGSIGLAVGLGAEIYKRWQVSGSYVWDVTYDVKTRKLDNFSARIQGWKVDVAMYF